MNNSIKLTIIKILKDIINKIENDECSLDDEEILSIAKNLVHIKLNIEQTCNYINVSRATFMCKADFLGSSIDDERYLCLYVKDVIDDSDGYDGLVFNHWYADMCRQGIPIDWHEFI